jgi:hypothetical protein
MAVCPNCKTNNLGYANFCANCGAKMPDAPAIPGAAVPLVMTAEPVKKGNPQHDAKATGGLILGISSIVFCWLGLISLAISVVGIVMSSLGLKSQKSRMAAGGLVMSIIGLILWIVVIIIGISLLTGEWFDFNSIY